MLNLNIGDVVYHAGKKRTIEAVKSVAGRTFFKLSGHAYMVRLDHVKPVIRLTDVVRAKIIVNFCATIAAKLPVKDPLAWDVLGGQDKKCTFEQYIWAMKILYWENMASNISRSGRFVGRGPINCFYKRGP